MHGAEDEISLAFLWPPTRTFIRGRGFGYWKRSGATGALSILCCHVV